MYHVSVMINVSISTLLPFFVLVYHDKCHDKHIPSLHFCHLSCRCTVISIMINVYTMSTLLPFTVPVYHDQRILCLHCCHLLSRCTVIGIMINVYYVYIVAIYRAGVPWSTYIMSTLLPFTEPVYCDRHHDQHILCLHCCHLLCWCTMISVMINVSYVYIVAIYCAGVPW